MGRQHKQNPVRSLSAETPVGSEGREFGAWQVATISVLLIRPSPHHVRISNASFMAFRRRKPVHAIPASQLYRHEPTASIESFRRQEFEGLMGIPVRRRHEDTWNQPAFPQRFFSSLLKGFEIQGWKIFRKRVDDKPFKFIRRRNIVETLSSVGEARTLHRE